MTGTADNIAEIVRALGTVRALPGTAAKRFIRDIQGIDLEKLTPKQVNYVMLLAHKFRRQMPSGLQRTIYLNHIKPRRIEVPSSAHMPNGAIWVGTGSPWDNPWKRSWCAVKDMYREIYKPRMLISRMDVKAATPAQKAHALAVLFQLWLEDRMGERNAAFYDRVHDLVYNQHTPNIPPPWTFEHVRAELRGKHLACEDPIRHESHADILLEIANGKEKTHQTPGRDETEA